MRVHRQIGQPSVCPLLHIAPQITCYSTESSLFSFLSFFLSPPFLRCLEQIPAYSVLLANPRKRSSSLAFVFMRFLFFPAVSLMLWILRDGIYRFASVKSLGKRYMDIIIARCIVDLYLFVM